MLTHVTSFAALVIRERAGVILNGIIARELARVEQQIVEDLQATADDREDDHEAALVGPAWAPADPAEVLREVRAALQMWRDDALTAAGIYAVAADPNGPTLTFTSPCRYDDLFPIDTIARDMERTAPDAEPAELAAPTLA